jgi:tyrosinase
MPFEMSVNTQDTYQKASLEARLQEHTILMSWMKFWDWGTNANSPSKSPVFDGLATPMRGIGEYLQNNGSVAGAGQIFLHFKQGGGCVTIGPFKDFVLPKLFRK